MIRVALFAYLPLVLATPAAAQAQSEKTHLDDFALPEAETGLSISQLANEERAQTLPAAQSGDRGLHIPGSSEPEKSGPIAQLPGEEQTARTDQLSNRADSRKMPVNGISSIEDSRPQHVDRLAGKDRCDPESSAPVSAECERIIERRATEFQAPEPPKLSPEQILMAERGDNLEQTASTTSSLRVRLAGGADPDAENRSNQELASIYLDQPTALPQTTIVPESMDSQALAEAIPELADGLKSVLLAPGQP